MYNEFSQGKGQQGKIKKYRSRGRVHLCGRCSQKLKNNDSVVEYLPKMYGHRDCIYPPPAAAGTVAGAPVLQN